MSLSTHMLRDGGERTLCGLNPAIVTLSLTQVPTSVTCRSCEISIVKKLEKR